MKNGIIQFHASTSVEEFRSVLSKYQQIDQILLDIAEWPDRQAVAKAVDQVQALLTENGISNILDFVMVSIASVHPVERDRLLNFLDGYHIHTTSIPISEYISVIDHQKTE